jgi:type 1 glutamine amidotransferase
MIRWIAILMAVATAFGQERLGAQRVTYRTRTLTGNDRLMSWYAGTGAAAFPRLTFLEAVAQTDRLGLAAIEGSSAEQVSPDIRKKLAPGLTDAELAVVTEALKNAAVTMRGYRVENLTADRRVFEFAKALGARWVIGKASKESLADLDKVATETGVKAAVIGVDAKALEGRSPSVGIATDSPKVSERLMVVDLKDRSANLTPFFRELNRAGVRPLLLTLEGSDMNAVADGFEKGVQPALGDFVDEASKTMAIRSGDTLPAEVRSKIEAAIPSKAYVQPKKARKLLVIDACVANMSHNTIPHFNYAIETMAKKTGAFEAVFSNDLANLRWPKIREWDAIYLNDTVGELFPDLEIRQSLLRYVREGGGLGGWHGSPWVSRSWRELSEMVSASSAPHRIEPAFLRPEDAKSPINQAFDGAGFLHTEEFYRFPHEGREAYYRPENVHVLLSVDADRSPAMFQPGKNGQKLYERPNRDYPVAWIKSYGKGRIYYNSLGHMPETMMSKPIMGHVLAAIQFLLGDLEADTTPNPKKP